MLHLVEEQLEGRHSVTASVEKEVARLQKDNRWSSREGGREGGGDAGESDSEMPTKHAGLARISLTLPLRRIHVIQVRIRAGKKRWAANKLVMGASVTHPERGGAGGLHEGGVRCGGHLGGSARARHSGDHSKACGIMDGGTL